MAEKKDAALPTEEEIDQMKLGKLTRLLREKFDMTSNDTDDMEKEEAREELKKRIRDIQATAGTSRRPGQAAENLREILDIHNSKRASLAELCRSIADYLANLDESNKDNLKLQFDRTAQDILTDVQTQLQKEECPILVAGETSSGKSTFLNLLLGGDILPVAHLSSTSTICEVKYGETRQAVVHLRKSGIIGKITGPKTVTIPLDGTQERQEELKSYMHLEGASRDKLPPAEKIEVFWPLPLLKGGIVIVDSPGVGESKMMDQVVADYIPKAFAFLYIIDSSRAGGVQQDRLGQLLQLYAEKDNFEDFNPESAMFICNKWDLVLADVSPEEQDKLKTETLRKLSDMWSGLKESQLFYVSTKKAVGLGEILSEDFIKVLDGLDLLLPKSLDNKLETQYRLLTRLSSAALTHIDVQLNIARQNLDKEGKAQKYRETMEHLEAFQEEAKQNMEGLESMVSNNTKTTMAFLSHLIETGKLKEKRLVIREKTGPFLFQTHLVVLGNEKKHSEGGDFSSFRTIYEEVARNSAQCSWFEEHIEPMETSFEQKTEEIVNSLQNACRQAMRVCANNPRLEPIRQSLKVHDVLSTRRSWWLWLFWRGRSLRKRLARWARSIAKAVGGSKSKAETILRNCWEEAPEGTPLVDILVQALSSSDELITELAERQMQTQRDLMALLEADITKMTTLMDQTIDQTFKDTRSNDEILQTYEPQSRDINSFLGQLAMFHLTGTRRYEYELDNIIGWTNTGNRIGGGSFGEVYRVQVPWKGAETPAALKLGLMPYDIITTETASDFLKEEDNLRKLKGKHIVEYYGTACRREGGGLRLGLVTELCDGTLADRIIGQRDLNPAWWGSDPEKQAAAFSYTQNLAVQLCEGLKQIHDAGYIHRDLKLINILVAKDTVKLADVGLTKQEVKITGTPAGTPVYAAPEVKEGKVYDKSADIYSLGLILLEMWYGRTLYGLENTTQGIPYRPRYRPDRRRPEGDPTRGRAGTEGNHGIPGRTVKYGPVRNPLSNVIAARDDIYSKLIEKDLKEGRDIRMPRWPGTVPPIPEWTRLIHDCLRVDPKKRPKIQQCLDRIKAMQLK
ncbi:hypothetical protein Bbelb_383340 [Branchiostoma belcheri]|nr:hypothetical protein Bbelb_383340 [Branchiostoma belcheri]